MKLSIGLVSIVLACASVAQQVPMLNRAQGRCPSIVTRREVRSISPGEFARIRNVIERMKGNGWFDWFSRLHIDQFGVVHGNSMFFPFHRALLTEFERIGRTIDPNFSVPYWDAARDFAAPHTSSVLSNSYIGGNGRGQNNCLMNGIQGNSTVNIPQRHCLRRVYNQGNQIRAWQDPSIIESMIQTQTTHDSFRRSLEYSLHGAVHLGLGGDMSRMEAPNDFAFYLHHANLDRIWWRWQKRRPENMMKIDGSIAGNRNATLNSLVTTFNIPMRSTMRLGENGMCFQYESDPISRNRLSKRQYGAHHMGEIERSIKTLDMKTLKKHFPLYAKECSKDSKYPYKPSTHHNKINRLPYPVKLDSKWMGKHGYNSKDAEVIRKKMITYIDDVYKGGYCSPYM